MLLQSIGVSLPAALAVALSPFPVIGIVLILAGTEGRRNGPLFAVGWIVGLTAVVAIVGALFGGADDPDSTSSVVADWLRVIGGAALIVAGVRKWSKRPRGGEEATPPAWMASLGETSPAKAAMLGAMLSGLNPKNFVLSATAATSMAATGAHGADLVVAMAVFVLIGSFTVIGAVVVRLLGGERGARLLESVRRFMVANSAVIAMVVLLILGAKVLGDGLGGLGR